MCQTIIHKLCLKIKTESVLKSRYFPGGMTDRLWANQLSVSGNYCICFSKVMSGLWAVYHVNIMRR